MRTLLVVAISLAVFGCSKEETPSAAPVASASASAVAAPSAAPVPSASAAASAAPEPHHDCPPGSSGIGSFAKPCDAKGSARMMTVKWKKTDDKGPNFSIKNVGPATILYGKIAVYFYDKGNKQLSVADASTTPPSTKPYQLCFGNFFQGVMKPSESATLTFSCVPKSAIPDGTVTTEAEMQMVGFADASGQKNDFYWRNVDLAPDARPKGGVK